MALSAPALQATPPTWAGNHSNDVTDPSNWLNLPTGVIPGILDQVVVSSGTASVTSNETYGALDFTGGSIGGSGTTLTLGIVANSNWGGGSLTFSGGGGLAVGNGATLNITGTGVTHDFNSTALTNHGNIAWSGGTLSTGNSGGITNNGTFTDTASDAIQNAFGGTSGFANSGHYEKDGFGTTTLGVTFNNTGTVDVNQGTLTFSGGGSNAAGAPFNVANGAGLEFSNGTFNFASGDDIVDNGGTYKVSGGNVTFAAGNPTLPTLTLTGGSLAFTSGGATSTSLTVTGGTLGAGTYQTNALTQTGGSLGSSALTVTGSGSVWSGGDMDGSGSVNIQNGAALEISGNVTHDFNHHAITNSGNLTWSGGTLQTGNSGSITNNGTFIDTASNTIEDAFGGAHGFNNGGNYNKNGGGTTTMGLEFTNSGNVTVNLGTLKLTGAATNTASGTINVVGGAELDVNNGLSLTSGSKLTGGGLARLVGGLLDANGVIAISNFEFDGGQLSGTNEFSGNVTWSGGDWSSTGGDGTTIDTGGTLNIDTTGTHDFNYRSITNHGTVYWNIGSLRGGNGSQFSNSGTFVDTNTGSSTMENSTYGGVFTFDNTGTYLKNGAGLTTIAVPFTNDNGIVSIGSGRVEFSSSYTHNGGTFIVGNGATAQFDHGLNIAAGSLIGTGTIIGNVVSHGLVMTGPPTGGTAGVLNITGDLSLLSASQLLIQLGGTTQGTTYDFINVSGNVTVGGLLNVKFLNTFANSVLSSETFQILTAGGLTGLFSNVGNGQRLLTMDGLGSFQVNYGGSLNGITLSNFEAVPEPSTYALLALGLLVVAAGVRRRRRA
ncbi:MAG TPA: PEP-CTERM sorting domain-containing protein [Opitutaceae bacterium]|nr:PEP-CTERM sorting domain-containing protein [Opitutaceae bacterium]